MNYLDNLHLNPRGAANHLRVRQGLFIADGANPRVEMTMGRVLTKSTRRVASSQTSNQLIHLFCLATRQTIDNLLEWFYDMQLADDIPDFTNNLTNKLFKMPSHNLASMHVWAHISVRCNRRWPLSLPKNNLRNTFSLPS